MDRLPKRFEEVLKEQKAKIATRRTVLNAQQKAALRQLEHSGRPEITMGTLGDISARFQHVMAKADFATREKLANLLINSVVLHKDKAIIAGNIPVTKTDVLNPSNPRTGLYSPCRANLVSCTLCFRYFAP